MSTITVTKELIGYEDISFADGAETPTDTFSRTTSTGGSQTIHKVSDVAIPVEDGNGYFTAENLAGVLDELYAAIDALDTALTDQLMAPADTVMAFGQSAAPTAWTRLTEGDSIYDGASDNAMFCFAKTGDIAQGGSADPQPAHLHQWYIYTDAVTAGKSFDSDGAERDITNTNDVPNGVVAGAVAGNYRLNQDCYTTKNTAPYYVEMILAKKD